MKSSRGSRFRASISSSMYASASWAARAWSSLSRMAFDDHPQVELNEGDTVVISAKPIPGNEVSVMETINRLLQSGAGRTHGADFEHAGELETALRPRLLVVVVHHRPIIGPARAFPKPNGGASGTCPATRPRVASALRRAPPAASSP